MIGIKRDFTDNDGITTWAITDARLVNLINEFLAEKYNTTLAQSARDYRVNKKGHVTFRSGMGYDIVDMDLFGGTGNGSRSSSFTVWKERREAESSK